MGKKSKSKGRNPRKVSPRAPASSPRAIATKQADPAMEAASQEAEDSGVCKHYRKGDAQVNRFLLKIHSSADADSRCEDCREEPGSKQKVKPKAKNVRKRGGAAAAEAKQGSGVVWVCLDCHHMACGGGVSESEPYGHARRHAKQARHSLAVRLDNPLVGWCFTCNSSVPIEMPDAQNGEGSQVADIEDVWFGENGESGKRTAHGGELLSPEHKRGYIVRGLTNLGNTCFFNSVMQNLLAMARLRDYFLRLDQAMGPLTMALRKLFMETGGGTETDYKSRITPSNLFGCVCSKAPQFRGYQQQDSHELLRYLLDGLCTEESSSRKLHANSHKDKTATESDKERTASDSVGTFVDAIFGGQLSSTVCCMECGHSSIVYEPFLDLSLPIPTKNAPTKNAPVTLPKRSKPPSKEGSRGRGKKIREKRGIRGIPALEKTESVSSPSVSNAYLCNTKPETEQVTSPILGDGSWWMDYVEPEQVFDTTNTESCSTSVVYGPENVGETYESSSELQTEAHPAESTRPQEHPKEEKVLPQIQDSGVILLPYKSLDSTAEEMTGSNMESHNNADMDLGDTAANELNHGTLSSVEVEQGFDGFGDLFNEPEAASDTKMETSICEDVGTSWLGGNSSESNQDEVDDTNAPVSVDRCLACFTMPELLSDEHAWHCENCSKILQHQNEENKRGRQPPVAQELGSKVLMSKSNKGKFIDQSCPRSSDSRVSDAATFRSVDNGNPMTTEVNCQQSNIKIDMEEHLAESDNTSQYLSCSSTPRRLISQASSNNEENDLCSRDELTDATNEDQSLEAGSSSSLDHRETVRESSHEKENSNEAVQVEGEGPNSSSTALAVDGSEEEKIGSYYRKIKRDATKRILINKGPYILTIHLKRFSQDARGRLSKLNGHVSFPETLDLRPYMDARCRDRDNFSYHLVGVVEHSGSMRGGHYVAYVKGEKSSGKMQKDGSSWFYASDVHVREVSLSEVLQSEAYILFYEKA